MSTAAGAAGTGNRRLRVEDEPLLRGRGRFTADIRPERVAAAAFLRSPHAAAEIRGIDTAAAAAMPGVLAVLTAADLAETGSMAVPLPVAGRGGAGLPAIDWPALARGRVLHVGQPVALVVAESLAAAETAVEAIAVEYQETKPVIGVRAAVTAGAPEIWPTAPGNVAIDWPGPDPGDGSNARAVQRVLAAAPLVARATYSHQRIAAAALEPRSATAEFDSAAGHYHLRCGSQGAFAMRNHLAGALRVKPELIRVVSEDTGGGFGMKSAAYPEYVALLVAARRLGRPVHWSSSRSEAFLSDNQAREMVTEAELALDADGQFLALRVAVLADLGAFLTVAGPLAVTTNLGLCLSSVYRIPLIACEVRGVFTNTVQTGAYRGAGRPEANYLIERLIEEAARLTGIDGIALRRRNLISREELPYKTPLGPTYDSGDFAACLDRALALADHAGFAARRARSAAAGKRRGIGIACFLEHAGGAPLEGAALAFPGDGRIVLGLGSGPSGQGHRTIFAAVAAERLGLAPEQIAVSIGDSANGVLGIGTIASRSTMVVGGAIAKVIDTVIEKGRTVAALALEAAEADIGYRDGAFEVTGTDRRLSLLEAAARAQDLAGATLDTNQTAQTPLSFPNGCHIAEVEIDPDTGTVALLAYSSADDSGRILNPMLVEGQIHGGMAQGLGQVLLENIVYDRASGQILAGSFMDYALPRATDMPPVFNDAFIEAPCTTNPLGVKGVGEAGTTGALGAVMNAICDALGAPGRTLDMPATPEKIWRACQSEPSERI